METLHLKEILEAVNGTAIWLDDSTRNENEIILKVGTNSRETMEQGLFVPVIGERVDAHDFIKGAFESGAIASFTSRHRSMDDVMADDSLKDYIDLKKGGVLITVEDTVMALQKLATYYRNKFKIPVIGISGSVGKTTTKEMISAALQTQLNVLKTFGNMNSQIGVALMMFELDHKRDVAVIEMGISEENEMNRLCDIAKPCYAVLTNIGVSHIANLKTRENIRKEKTKIANAFLESSVLFVNGNDDLLQEIYLEKEKNSSMTIDLDDITKEKLMNARVLAFGTQEFCGFQAYEIKTQNEKTTFMMRYPAGEMQVKLNVCGIHNVYNALVAMALAYEFGIDLEVAKSGLEQYEPVKMRGQIFTFHNIKVIDDTYNASPDSMRSGVNVLLDLSGVNRRIAILADVLELGEHSRECHYGVGEYIAKTKVDVLVTIGSQAKFIAKAVNDNNITIKTYSFETNEEANQFLTGFIQKQDGILVKGSRGMHTEQVVEYLKELVVE